MLHFLKRSSDQEIQQALNLRSSYFLREYRLAVRNYSLPQVQGIIGVLKDYDLRSKGVDNDSADDAALMKELIWKILH